MTRRRAYAYLTVALLTLAGCGGTSGGGRPNVGTSQPSQGTAANAESGERQALTASQAKLTIKILDKDCFGSAGCNITYRVKAGWPKANVPDGVSYEVTYKVSGPEDGEQIGTLTINGDGTFDATDEAVSTPKSSTTLKATATEVERVP